MRKKYINEHKVLPNKEEKIVNLNEDRTLFQTFPIKTTRIKN